MGVLLVRVGMISNRGYWPLSNSISEQALFRLLYLVIYLVNKEQARREERTALSNYYF